MGFGQICKTVYKSSYLKRVKGHCSMIVKSKGKAVPLQVWSSPEGSRKLSFPYFMTTAQEGGKVVNGGLNVYYLLFFQNLMIA